MYTSSNRGDSTSWALRLVCAAGAGAAPAVGLRLVAVGCWASRKPCTALQPLGCGVSKEHPPREKHGATSLLGYWRGAESWPSRYDVRVCRATQSTQRFLSWLHFSELYDRALTSCGVLVAAEERIVEDDVPPAADSHNSVVRVARMCSCVVRWSHRSVLTTDNTPHTNEARELCLGRFATGGLTAPVKHFDVLHKFYRFSHIHR